MESIPGKEPDTKSVQSIYFAYKVGIISSYSNRTYPKAYCSYMA